MVSTTTQPIAGQYWLWREQKIYFVKAGHNPQLPPLLLVHGFGASTDHWRKNISELSQDFEVYAIDLLGFGRSPLKTLDRSATFPQNTEIFKSGYKIFYESLIKNILIYLNKEGCGTKCHSPLFCI
jgi:pimeloyl-ACP methyl ester carboxylesterase